MPFKKLHSDIQEKLEYLEIVTPTAFQSKSIPVIKSGSNVYCTAAKDSGKTTTLILTTLQKLRYEAVGTLPRAIVLVENKERAYEAVGTLPRAIVLVENKERALELFDAFLTYTRYNSLRVYVGYEQLHIDVQKSEIFEGIDILISTPTTMNKLFLSNGVSTSQLKIFSVDDAEFLVQKTAYNALMSITQSIGKCQYVLYLEKMHPILERFGSYFMEYSKKIKI